MNAESHNRTLGILHLIYGGLSTLVLVFVVIFFAAFFSASGILPPDARSSPEFFFLAAFMVAALVVSLALAIIPLLAGYALLMKKSWARMAGLIAAFTAAISFPHGTALCVYSLWFLFGDGAKLYKAMKATGGSDFPRGSLNSQPASWRGSWQVHEREYVPPTEPPNWRD